jgi:hypothetical protein
LLQENVEEFQQEGLDETLVLYPVEEDKRKRVRGLLTTNLAKAMKMLLG